jgi:hypothetical protein
MEMSSEPPHGIDLDWKEKDGGQATLWTVKTALYRATTLASVFTWALTYFALLFLCQSKPFFLYSRDIPQPLQGWKRTLPDRNGGETPSCLRTRHSLRPPLVI